jgi:hypothetical protein
MRAGRVEELKGTNVSITLAWGGHDTLVRNRPLRAKALLKKVELSGCWCVPTWADPGLVARGILAGTRRTPEKESCG